MKIYLLRFLVFSSILPSSVYSQDQGSDSEKLFTESIKYTAIIGLGESSHGYENINFAKAMATQYLADNENFNTILFESSFTGGLIPYLLGDSLNTRCSKFLYAFWNINSVKNVLKRFVENEKEKPLIAGFDIQEDCRYKQFSQYLLKHNYVKHTSNQLLLCDSVLSLCIGETANEKRQLSIPEYNLLVASYDSISKEIATITGVKEISKKLLLQCIENRKWLCKYLTIQKLKERMYFRDSLMAQNIIWLKNNLYSNEKILLWAADTHIGKMKANESNPEWMGEWLTKAYGDDYYAISFRKGNTPDNSFMLGNASLIIEKKKGIFQAFFYLSHLKKIGKEQWETPCL